MSLTKFNENVNNHQSLPDQPSQTAAQLKTLFDKAANDIKTYINSTLTTEIDTAVQGLTDNKVNKTDIVNDLTTGGATKVASAEMAKSLKGLIDTANTNINTKLPKSGGTMTGDINYGNGKGIYWKENGYGDKFKLVPDFTGADDSNVMKLQGAVGGANTDPTLYDLVKVTAKSGNVWAKGTITAPNFSGRWNNWVLDSGTENTSDTWLLVLNNDKIQHRTISNIINSYLKNGATTKITSGTSTPTGGDNGDVYIQYF